MVLGHDPYDETVLELARKLCRELSVTRHKSQKLIWSRTVASDECRFTPPAFRSRGIRLQLALRGKLTPEEFAPIIASSLVFSYKTRWGEGTRLFLPSLLPAVIVLFVTSMFGRAWDLKTVFPIAFLGCVLIALIAAMSFNRHVKRLKLNADRRSARLVGRDALLSVLTRIESLKLEDVERWKRNRAQSIIHSKPTVEERIRNLSV